MAEKFNAMAAGETGGFNDEAWAEVLSAVDRTYADLVEYQERLERQNVQLEDMRAFLASILSSVSDVLIVVDRAGTVEQVNQSLVTLTGKNEEDFTGGAVSAMFARNQRSTIEAILEQAQERRRPVNIEIDLLTTDEAEPLDLSAAPRLDDHGRVEGFVLAGRPLGALRKAYAELSDGHDALKNAQTLLVRNEKLASLGRLLAGVAHELNNPISFVYANAHAMERYADKFETYFARVQDGASRAELIQLREDLRLDRAVKNLREAINGARDGAERVRDIVEDLRRLSSDGSGEQLVFDLAETARIGANWIMRGMKQPITLDLEGLESAKVLGNAGHVQQVVMNLVQNSVDAVEGQEAPLVTLSLKVTGESACLTVADNGPGIPPELRTTVFDPFFTTKPVGRGTGLGLSISHKIAEEHGGALILREGPGCVFCLELPLAKGDAE